MQTQVTKPHQGHAKGAAVPPLVLRQQWNTVTKDALVSKAREGKKVEVIFYAPAHTREQRPAPESQGHAFELCDVQEQAAREPRFHFPFSASISFKPRPVPAPRASLLPRRPTTFRDSAPAQSQSESVHRLPKSFGWERQAPGRSRWVLWVLASRGPASEVRRWNRGREPLRCCPWARLHFPEARAQRVWVVGWARGGRRRSGFGAVGPGVGRPESVRDVGDRSPSGSGPGRRSGRDRGRRCDRDRPERPVSGGDGGCVCPACEVIWECVCVCECDRDRFLCVCV